MTLTARPLTTPYCLLRPRAMICGAVQGVGFRPFVYRLATDLGLTGWARDPRKGGLIEAEGGEQSLSDLLRRLESEKPPRASIQSIEATFHESVGYTAFEARDSDPGGQKTVPVLPGIAVCGDCLSEVPDPADRW